MGKGGAAGLIYPPFAGAYRYYEGGERVPQLSVLIKPADYFDVSWNGLVGRESLRSGEKEIHP